MGQPFRRPGWWRARADRKRSLPVERILVVEGGCCRAKSVGRYRSQLALAVRLGVSPRRLDQWEHREFHEYVYDGDRLVGAIVSREAEFSPNDVVMLTAHLAEEARPRNSLGVFRDEALDPANQFRYQGRDKPLIDHAEAAVGKRQDAYYEAAKAANGGKDIKRHGHIWTLRD